MKIKAITVFLMENSTVVMDKNLKFVNIRKSVNIISIILDSIIIKSLGETSLFHVEHINQSINS